MLLPFQVIVPTHGLKAIQVIHNMNKEATLERSLPNVASCAVAYTEVSELRMFLAVQCAHSATIWPPSTCSLCPLRDKVVMHSFQRWLQTQ